MSELERQWFVVFVLEDLATLEDGGDFLTGVGLVVDQRLKGVNWFSERLAVTHVYGNLLASDLAEEHAVSLLVDTLALELLEDLLGNLRWRTSDVGTLHAGLATVEREEVVVGEGGILLRRSVFAGLLAGLCGGALAGGGGGRCLGWHVGLRVQEVK